jgi:hypothetical protein
MSEKISQVLYYSCVGCLGITGLLTIFSTFLSSNFLYLKNFIWTICTGIYYFIVVIIYLGLFSVIVKNSFDHVEEIILLKMTNEMDEDYDPDEVSKNTKRIFKHILLNLLFLFISFLLNLYFDYVVVKVPLILYICWTLGFAACFPINKDLSTKLNNDQIKDYILQKSVINTMIFLLIYIFVKNI